MAFYFFSFFSTNLYMQLVWNKADCIVELESATLYAAPKDYPPFSCQAIVEEQDTHLLLREQTTLTDPGKPAWYLANTLESEVNHSLGEVIIRGQSPKRLLAIVHDIEQSPTCTSETVKLAYQNILTTVKGNYITSFALPLLGTAHGKLTATDSINLFGSVFLHNSSTCFQRIWLILPEGTNCSCLSQLTLLQR